MQRKAVQIARVTNEADASDPLAGTKLQKGAGALLIDISAEQKSVQSRLAITLVKHHILRPREEDLAVSGCSSSRREFTPVLESIIVQLPNIDLIGKVTNFQIALDQSVFVSQSVLARTQREPGSLRMQRDPVRDVLHYDVHPLVDLLEAEQL